MVFPDFFKTSVQDLWQRLIVKHHKQITFDALWIVSLLKHHKQITFDALWIVSQKNRSSEPGREKTGFLHMRKQRCRSASR